MKHACALLVHSIERGLPMWPSSCTDLRPNTGTGSTVKASVSEPQSKCQGQGAHVSSGALGNESPVCKEMHDSGVAFSNQSTARLGIPGQNGMSGTAASAGTGRFYGRQLSTTPLEKKPFDRGRARGQSFATDVSSVPSRPRSSSPVLFPYSPPQADAQWVHGEDEDNTTPPDNLLERNAFLGAEGITWLRASLDIHRLGKHEYTTYPTESKDQVDVSSVPVSGPQPRRFYSTRRLPSEKIFQPHEWADDVASSRAPSSVRSLSFDEEKRDMSIHDWAHRNLHDHYSSKGLDNPEAIYSVVMPGAQPRHRRKRASQLFKKLVGIRRKEDSHGSVENKRVDRAVATAA